MLVLSRKEGDAIVIDGQIEVTVLRVEGNKVRIGITAPREVRVVRGELERFDEPQRRPPLSGLSGFFSGTPAGCT